tara:strand:+ start:2545 stop:3105 length:561 start_codon:yes stop_codon:yes gene_type:complete
MEPWITTFTGKHVNLKQPSSDQITLVDIAHALSNVCRFTGHCNKFYSVAQHCIHVSSILPNHLKLTGLLHDATEAYLTDISSPLKAVLPEYRKLENTMWSVIAKEFCLPDPLPSDIKHADRILLATEKRDLLNHPDEIWSLLLGIIPLKMTIEPWTPAFAKEFFLLTASQLMAQDYAKESRHTQSN